MEKQLRSILNEIDKETLLEIIEKIDKEEQERKVNLLTEMRDMLAEASVMYYTYLIDKEVPDPESEDFKKEARMVTESLKKIESTFVQADAFFRKGKTIETPKEAELEVTALDTDVLKELLGL